MIQNSVPPNSADLVEIYDLYQSYYDSTWFGKVSSSGDIDLQPKEERIAALDAHITLQFGEFRLVCLIHVQTQLLLWRATAWQLHEILGFQRDMQLPFFTMTPDSEVSKVLLELVQEIAQFDFNGDGRVDHKDLGALTSAIRNVLEARTCKDLLQQVTALGPLLAQGWFHLLATAIKKHLEMLGEWKRVEEAQSAINEQGTRVSPELEKQISDLSQKVKKIKTDIKTTLEHPRITGTAVGSWFHLAASTHPIESDSTESMTRPDSVDLLWKRSELDDSFLKSTSKLAQKYREYPRPQSTYDRLAFHTAYYLLSQGQNEFDPYKARFLGTVGFRESDCQTYLSLTDPGQGHVFGTTMQAKWMKGAIVHVEHLERPSKSGMDAIESYRMPSVREFSRVCLHASSAAPTTCYVGRPLRDSEEFTWDFIKVVDTVSSSCSSMFQLGAAECKIGMSRMRASQMVAYMRALRGHTLKNYRQYFSAAFNLNTPLIDDINGLYIKDRMNIGLRAIELAALGGFDKVTWDGAANTYPSVPLLQASENDGGQLSLTNAVKLVHYAHSVGLTTYFSAGFKAEHIKTAVYSGVDGIGIGGAQVLRGMDHTAGMHGEYQESRIDDLIKERDEAARTPQGQAARLLARLDQMFFEGSINEVEAIRRDKLFDLLSRTPSSKDLEDILEDGTVRLVLAMPEDGEQPWKGRANRLINERNNLPSLLRQHGRGNWATFKRSIELSNETEGGLHSLSMSHQWKEMRRNYHEWALKTNDQLPKYFMGEIDVALKLTPYGDPKSLAVSDLDFKS